MSATAAPAADRSVSRGEASSVELLNRRREVSCSPDIVTTDPDGGVERMSSDWAIDPRAKMTHGGYCARA